MNWYGLVKRKKHLYLALGCCALCLLTTLIVQTISTNILYDNAIAFEKHYLKSTVDTTCARIDILRKKLREQQMADTGTFDEEKIKQDIIGILRQDFYQSADDYTGAYCWINAVRDYEGGKEYAVRLIHPNLRDTEGVLLSTETQDAKGDRPYLTELEGIKQHGSITYSYYFKDMNSESITQKLTYARLYEDYGWIICMGIPYNAVWGDVLFENSALKWLLLISYLVSVGGVFVIAFSLYKQARQERREHRNEVSKLQRQIEYDGLTKARSRIHGVTLLEDSLECYRRTMRHDVIAMFDLDHFKAVNDNYGHEFGDYVLREVVATISQNIRSGDTLIRWGGDEFVLILSAAAPQHIQHILKKLNLCIRNREFATKDGKIVPITISIGASCFQPEDTNIEAVMSRADIALYKAKYKRDTYYVYDGTDIT